MSSTIHSVAAAQVLSPSADPALFRAFYAPAAERDAALVDPRTLVGVHPNCNISCNARGAWLEVPAASSMELVALRPAGMEL